MTDAERARALSLLKQECSCHGNAAYGSTSPEAHEWSSSCTCCRDKCGGKGYYYVLGDRARRECPHCRGAGILMVTEWEPCPTCEGPGLLSTLVIKEACHDRHNIEVSSSRCRVCGVWQTDPPDTVYRPDEELVRKELQRLGYDVEYMMCLASGSLHRGIPCWRVALNESDEILYKVYHDPNILIAACQALGVEETA